MKKSNLMIALASVSILTMSAVSALVPAKIDVHHIAPSPNLGYQIDGPDPYFTFEPINDEQVAQYLVINFKLDATSTRQKNIPMELFFKEPNDTEQHFDPMYRLQFSVPTAYLRGGSTAFALELPSDRVSTSKNLMRLDIDACSDCRFTLISQPKLTSYLQDNVKKIDPNRIFNGLTDLPEGGRSLPISKWQLNDLTQSSTQLRVSGGDPFIISPPLNSATAELAGVYLELQPDNIALRSYNFQLFYATEHHGFTERAATSFAVKVNGSGSKGSGPIKFFIPLHFLSTERPGSILLERIRLDLPQDVELRDSSWGINTISLVHQSQLEAFQNLIPQRRLTTKAQRASGFGLTWNIVTKIVSDLGFTLAYLLLLLTCGLGFWRSFEK